MEFKAFFLGTLDDVSGHDRAVTAHGNVYVSPKGVSFDGKGDFLTISNFGNATRFVPTNNLTATVTTIEYYSTVTTQYGYSSIKLNRFSRI